MTAIVKVLRRVGYSSVINRRYVVLRDSRLASRSNTTFDDLLNIAQVKNEIGVLKQRFAQKAAVECIILLLAQSIRVYSRLVTSYVLKYNGRYLAPDETLWLHNVSCRTASAEINYMASRVIPRGVRIIHLHSYRVSFAADKSTRPYIKRGSRFYDFL